MPTSTSHGRRYIEPERHNELSGGIVAPVEQAEGGDERRDDGTFAQDAKTAQSKGGKALKGRTRLSHHIGGEKLTRRSRDRARALRVALCAEIVSTVGGGMCGIAASLLVKFAAQKTAAAEEAYDRGDYDAHRRLSESARMDLLYGREVAAKAALARREAGGGPVGPPAITPAQRAEIVRVEP